MSDEAPVSLFRQKAIDAQRPEWTGSVILVQPLSLRLMALVTACVLVLILVALTSLSYTHRTTVRGEIAVADGYAKVLGTKGIIKRAFVKEGQHVRTGEPLFEISDPRHAQSGDINEMVTEQLEVRRASLEKELSEIRSIHPLEQENLGSMVEGLRSEMSRIESIVAGLRRRHQLARLAQERTHGLYKQGFISKEGLQAREAEVIDAYGRLTAMLRDEVSMRRQLQERLTEQRSLPARQSSQRLQLERALAMVHQEAAENAGRRGILVKAPQSGVVTAVLGEVGQALSGNEQLLAIVPEKADRIAHLYAASSGIAFVREGTQVMLRFEAFPFQKYGHGHGVVTQVSRVPVSATQGGEPLYRVSVALAKQYHRSGKGNMPLVPGMRVDADLLLDTRKLYEWALDPIFGMTKIFAAAGGQHDAR